MKLALLRASINSSISCQTSLSLATVEKYIISGRVRTRFRFICWTWIFTILRASLSSLTSSRAGSAIIVDRDGDGILWRRILFVFVLSSDFGSHATSVSFYDEFQTLIIRGPATLPKFESETLLRSVVNPIDLSSLESSTKNLPQHCQAPACSLTPFESPAEIPLQLNLCSFSHNCQPTFSSYQLMSSHCLSMFKIIILKFLTT